jgi:hypothetical protein
MKEEARVFEEKSSRELLKIVWQMKREKKQHPESDQAGWEIFTEL